MTKIFILISFIFQFVFCLSQAVLVHSGTYQGKNVYVQNPFALNGIGFSVKEVTVNGEPITNDIISSAFVIDLKKLNFTIGDPVTIKLYHDNGCEPQIINKSSLLSKSTISFSEIKLDSTGLLSWCVSASSQTKTTHVEQYKWDNWIEVGELTRTPSDSISCYEFQTLLTSGINKFRLLEYDFNDYPNRSTTVSIINPTKKVTMHEYFNPHDNGIRFSEKTIFEVLNKYGETVIKGYENYIDLYDFDYGDYTIKFDNQIATWRYDSKFERINK